VSSTSGRTAEDVIRSTQCNDFPQNFIKSATKDLHTFAFTHIATNGKLSNKSSL